MELDFTVTAADLTNPESPVYQILAEADHVIDTLTKAASKLTQLSKEVRAKIQDGPISAQELEETLFEQMNDVLDDVEDVI